MEDLELICLNDDLVIFDYKDYKNNFDIVEFDLNKKFKTGHYAISIDFRNDVKYSIKCIKKLILLKKSNIPFCYNFKDYKVKYVISNYNDAILNALKAIEISDLKEKYTFIYDSVFKQLDDIWSKKNYCNFCNNKCIATRMHKNIDQLDGCCYSFRMNTNLFSTNFIKNKQKCKFLGDDKRCTTQNISCKLFTCDYLKKTESFDIKLNDFLLVMAFFNSKQRLILKYNYFNSKEEIIDKLLEKSKMPLALYYYYDYYRI